MWQFNLCFIFGWFKPGFMLKDPRFTGSSFGMTSSVAVEGELSQEEEPMGSAGEGSGFSQGAAGTISASGGLEAGVAPNLRSKSGKAAPQVHVVRQ